MSIKVSVIVPIYNVQNYLRKAVDSLLNQTLKDIEIILVDDGSLDNCGKIIDEYAEKHGNIIAIHKENGGVSDARNTGMEKAAGEYIGFIDPDDYAQPEMFENLYKSITENNCDLSICGYKEVFSKTEQQNVLYEPSGNTAEDLFSDFLDGKFGAYVWNKLYKSSVIKENNVTFPVGINLVEDQMFLFEYLKYMKTFSVSYGYYYNYIRNPNSICARYNNTFFDFYKLSYEKAGETADCFEDKDIYREKTKKFIFAYIFGLPDRINSYSRKATLKTRYAETKRVVGDPWVLELLDANSNEIKNKKNIKKARLIKKGKIFSLFLYELFVYGFVGKINYYLK